MNSIVLKRQSPLSTTQSVCRFALCFFLLLAFWVIYLGECAYEDRVLESARERELQEALEVEEVFDHRLPADVAARLCPGSGVNEQYEFATVGSAHESEVHPYRYKNLRPRVLVSVAEHVGAAHALRLMNNYLHCFADDSSMMIIHLNPIDFPNSSALHRIILNERQHEDAEWHAFLQRAHMSGRVIVNTGPRVAVQRAASSILYAHLLNLLFVRNHLHWRHEFMFIQQASNMAWVRKSFYIIDYVERKHAAGLTQDWRKIGYCRFFNDTWCTYRDVFPLQPNYPCTNRSSDPYMQSLTKRVFERYKELARRRPQPPLPPLNATDSQLPFVVEIYHEGFFAPSRWWYDYISFLIDERLMDAAGRWFVRRVNAIPEERWPAAYFFWMHFDELPEVAVPPLCLRWLGEGTAPLDDFVRPISRGDRIKNYGDEEYFAIKRVDYLNSTNPSIQFIENDVCN